MPTGFYKHYKGGRYLVLGFVPDADNKAPQVWYYSLDHNQFWNRSLADFLLPAIVDGKEVVRFKLVRELQLPILDTLQKMIQGFPAPAF